jgi:hypothetical protein
MDSHAARYGIYVRGHLSGTLLSAFPELHGQLLDGVPVLVGELPDQAALHGVLSRIEALGLELLEVGRLAPRPTVSTTEAGRATRNAP